METIIIYITPGFTALAFAAVGIPFMRSFANRFGLVDKPNHRKLHHTPIPLVGGISVFMTIALVLALCGVSLQGAAENVSVLLAAVVMLVAGAWDDKSGIRPIYRLLIQAACAYIVASAGIRIESLYGILGIGEIPVTMQYVITVVVITGVVNAYNLMDGIDGLLGSLVLITAAVLAAIAWYLHATEVMLLMFAVAGAVTGFLRHNFSGTGSKVFMGDAGALSLGFILVVSAIRLLNLAEGQAIAVQTKTMLLISSVFFVPVLDSLRVYIARLMRGTSPFKADKTHLHHLFLSFGFSHKIVSVILAMAIILIVLVVEALANTMAPAWVILTGVTLFSVLPGTWHAVQLLNARMEQSPRTTVDSPRQERVASVY
ncbi:undecaprenyl/decaprenyl-phosphate alpha-N-acetylglucosaminyl 1-phosphate transferase [Fulvivirgaceae bacterium PWU4]|uniref:Undecaprenyl/decaprenyl-phosphate alpha-N-acetylglucosaminyl 1-phosphate transferase n=1 Tax=Chryseosolibacter histidini TaxID=2782349 RepID=A0AAP2DNL3_9BACT|nr:MraY family glycosyltransferase [Chryseosolibacter histidini]MBT1698749.1 undecaprenyl/decaprenyl-phosphate alpha-N-acetylglucosaminyl 1-phosphate transferase [Chryseosolibacter histidini]